MEFVLLCFGLFVVLFCLGFLLLQGVGWVGWFGWDF